MPRRVTVTDLIDDISAEAGVGRDQAFAVISAFAKKMSQALDQRKTCAFWNIGTFSVRDDENGFPEIRFAASLEFRKHVHVRPEMNKYGVVLDRNKVMTAKLTGLCPDCNTDLESKDPPKCPRCGTKPFEEKERADGK